MPQDKPLWIHSAASHSAGRIALTKSPSWWHFWHRIVLPRSPEANTSLASQQKFWQMHDELFTHQSALEDRALSRYAKRIGLNLERFTNDMNEHSFLQRIEADYQRSLFDQHITGTPTIFLNDNRYTGATD